MLKQVFREILIEPMPEWLVILLCGLLKLEIFECITGWISNILSILCIYINLEIHSLSQRDWVCILSTVVSRALLFYQTVIYCAVHVYVLAHHQPTVRLVIVI